MKKIKLSKGKYALVDDEDFDELNKVSWCYGNDGYARRGKRISGTGKTKSILMHRQIMNAPPGNHIDHVDGDGLNNQRANLRFATIQQNSYNVPPQPGGTSKYKGVCWFKRVQKWVAYIDANGKRIHLGYFTDEIEAARAYDAAAIERHGEFAYLNFQPENTP